MKIINDEREYFVRFANGEPVFSPDPNRAMVVDESQINGMLGNVYLRVEAGMQLRKVREIQIRRAA